jgi:uncharacterized protein YjlB
MEEPVQPETLIFKDDGETPNSRLPLLVYKGVLGSALPGTADPDLAAACEYLFEQNGWPPAWRASVHPFSHFHTRCHEALGVVRGSGRVQFGGARGRTVTCEAGDVVVLPAGVGHQRLESSSDFLIVGAYPDNTAQRDQQRPGTIDHVEALRRIAAVPAPAQDPVFGKDGPLVREWR